MKEVSCQQRSEAWFAARRGLPTASRFDKILTAKKGEPAAAQEGLIDELLAESLLPPQQGVIRPATEEMYEGMRLEAEARCAFEVGYASEPVKEVGLIIHESGMFGASPDALVGGDSGVELKCPNGATQIGYLRAGVLPSEYRCQVHGSMVVTGRKTWSFFSYARNLPPLHLLVEWDWFTDKLAAELIKFSSRYNAERVKFGLQPFPVQ